MFLQCCNALSAVLISSCDTPRRSYSSLQILPHPRKETGSPRSLGRPGVRTLRRIFLCGFKRPTSLSAEHLSKNDCRDIGLPERHLDDVVAGPVLIPDPMYRNRRRVDQRGNCCNLGAGPTGGAGFWLAQGTMLPVSDARESATAPMSEKESARAVPSTGPLCFIRS